MNETDIKPGIERYRQKIHVQIIQDALKWTMIVLIPAIIIQFFRIVDTGFQPIMILVIAATITIIVFVVFQKLLPYRFKAMTYILLFFIMGIGSLFNYSLIGGGTWLLILSTALAALLFPRKVYVMLITIAALTFLICAIIYSNKIITFGFDISAYAYSPFSWYASVFAITFVMLLISISIEKINKHLIQNQTELINKNQKLLDLNLKLEAEIESRKQAEESTKEREEIYRKLFESANAAILIINADFKFIDCNAMATRLLGRSKQEILGASPADLTITPMYQPNGELSSEYGRIFFSSSMEGNDLRFEWTHLHKDGTEIPVEVSLFGFNASNKKNFFAMWRDLTEVKEKEQALKESEERYRSLFFLAGDAAFVIQHNVVIDCNEKALQVLKVPKKQLIGIAPWNVSPPYQPDGKDSKVKAIEKIQAALQGSPQQFEWVHRLFDGSLIDIEISLNVIDKENEVLFSVWRDITERKQLQRRIYNARVEAEESERSRYAKELHDGLGPILSSVKFNFEWLSETTDTKKRRQIIDLGNKNIEEAIVSLKEISNNLNPHILGNYGLFEAIKTFIAKIARKSDIKFVYNSNCEKRLNSELEITLYRIVQELINNTLKYAGAKKVAIEFIEDVDNNTLSLIYSDDGVGFDLQEALDKRKGFGLFNIQNRIDLLGGNISILTSKDHGMELIININLSTNYLEKK